MELLPVGIKPRAIVVLLHLVRDPPLGAQLVNVRPYRLVEVAVVFYEVLKKYVRIPLDRLSLKCGIIAAYVGIDFMDE